MKGNGDCYRRRLQFPLHDLMTAALTHGNEPFCSRIRQTSEPERTRSLPNRYLDLSYKDLAVSPPSDFRR
jgi:hypothetical protein